MDNDTLHDYVVAFGFGAPTDAAYCFARERYKQGEDYATIAHEIVARGLTKNPEE